MVGTENFNKIGSVLELVGILVYEDISGMIPDVPFHCRDPRPCVRIESPAFLRRVVRRVAETEPDSSGSYRRRFGSNAHAVSVLSESRSVV